MTRTNVNGFAVDARLHEFIEEELLPAVDVDSGSFWAGLTELLATFTPRNNALMRTRAEFQQQLDDYHRAHPGPVDVTRYEKFLADIGYLLPEPSSRTSSRPVVDPEIGTIAGPQLVVPVTNARYAVNAVNARWGSLYDALYGSNVVDGDEPRDRRTQVVSWTKQFLDRNLPLRAGSHADVTSYHLDGNHLVATISGGIATELVDPSTFIGFTGDIAAPTAFLLRHNNLHIELKIDRNHPVGAADPAGVRDVILESAITAIIDFEDAVSIVDAADKVHGYRNWLGLNTGDLEASFVKNGEKRTRRLQPDRRYDTPSGQVYTVAGRALMFTRNVGLHLLSDMILDREGLPVPESLVDLVLTAAAALPGLRRDQPNSRHGNIYIVRPKMHGPEEVQFVCDAASHVEQVLGIASGSIKLGVMDEERRASLNLAACLAAAGSRLAFVNTGFLDRTGSEIRSSFHAGPFPFKSDMKAAPWYQAYEDFNVDIALALDLPGNAQIGKGMWTLTDDLRTMVDVKRQQLQAGATTGWVPSPTAATLHATHYHDIDVVAVHEQLKLRPPRQRREMLTPPEYLHSDTDRTPILKELDNNVQSILAYVVRWIDLGVGSSKVLDMDGVALMEDRATLRISSQLLANWLAHNIISEGDIRASLNKMAVLVDEQNRDEADIPKMSDNLESDRAWSAAAELIFAGERQPGGYPEFVLHRARSEYKQSSPIRQTP
ncbi:malate synthase G [Rhodococcus sp. KBW08]|uniref:malate synthase G n=1 Tax=Rhodococcus sp. KBW08 TaxID=2144188 RepID=UPI000F590937|nr:malate synthase G [Rhodococcus sp. KBW08]RQO50017.1 malate synthase G [Rhodococcus sp. KBW08]